MKKITKTWIIDENKDENKDENYIGTKRLDASTNDKDLKTVLSEKLEKSYEYIF